MIPFLQKKSVGIDIADNSIEIIELSFEKNAPKISAWSRAMLKSDIVENGRVKNDKKLVYAIQYLLDHAKPHRIKPKNCYVSLPEKLIYIHLVTLSAESGQDIGRNVIQEVRENIPLPFDDLVYQFSIVHADNGYRDIVIAAAEKSVVAEWHDVFMKLNIKLKGFNVETIATARGLLHTQQEQPLCVVDIGSHTTTISIFDMHGLRYVHSIEISGETITQNIAAVLRTARDTAEQRKRDIGLTGPKDKLFASIVKILELIVKEISLSITYYEAQSSKPVSKIILVGGTSMLKGIREYIFENTNRDTEIGVPILSNTNAALKNQPHFIEAIGLALTGYKSVSKGAIIIPCIAPGGKK